MSTLFTFTGLCVLHGLLSRYPVASGSSMKVNHQNESAVPHTHGIREKRREHLDQWGEVLEHLMNETNYLPNDDDDLRSESTNRRYVDRFHWNLAGRGEYPWVGIIHVGRLQETTFNLLARGSACGAVILTVKAGMTMCACMETYMLRLSQEPRVEELSKHTPFNIQRKKNLSSPETLYFTYDQIQFKPDYKHRVNWMLNKECYTGQPNGQGGRGEQDYYWHYGFFLFEFIPELEDLDVSVMPPPFPGTIVMAKVLNKFDSREYLRKTAQVVGFSMRTMTATGDPISGPIKDSRPFNDYYGFPIDMNNALVVLEVEVALLVECSRTGRWTRNDLSKWEKQKDQVVCFKFHEHITSHGVFKGKREAQLCGPSLAGFPVVRDDHVIGLVARASNCLPNRPYWRFLLVRVLDEQAMKMIESLEGRRAERVRASQNNLFRYHLGQPADYSMFIDLHTLPESMSKSNLYKPILLEILACLLMDMLMVN